jgi:hypothetical protein
VANGPKTSVGGLVGVALTGKPVGILTKKRHRGAISSGEKGPSRIALNNYNNNKGAHLRRIKEKAKVLFIVKKPRKGISTTNEKQQRK